MTPEPRRDAQLDGLRGLAILLVVFYHVTVSAPPLDAVARLTVLPASTGWSGVDLFFVLSGFLITRILLAEREAARYYSAFYARRVLRIFPLYYVFLAGVFWLPAWLPGLDLFWLPGADRAPAWYWLYLANVHAARAGHFHHLFLSVTWSLAIEEQFYLAWPFLVRRLTPRVLERLCAGIVLASPVARAVALAAHVAPFTVYVLTPFRLDTLAVGAWIALRSACGEARTLARWARLVGPLAAAACVAWFAALALSPGALGGAGLPDVGHPVTQVAGYSALALAYGALLAALLGAPPGSWSRRAFSVAPLRALGTYSYAIYLFHVPAIEFCDRWILEPGAVHWPDGLKVVVWGTGTVLVSLGAARVSWALLEGPALRLRARFPYAVPVREAAPGI